MSNISALFVGGPVDGKMAIIPDVMEYSFPIAPEIDWNDPEQNPDELVPVPHAIYRRLWSDETSKIRNIFEFVEIK